MENGYSLCPKTTKELLVTNDSYFIPEPSCNKPTSNIIGLPCWRYTRLNKSLETWVWNVKPKLWYLNLLVMAHLAASEAHHLWSIIVSISALLLSCFWFAERLLWARHALGHLRQFSILRPSWSAKPRHHDEFLTWRDSNAWDHLEICGTPPRDKRKEHGSHWFKTTSFDVVSFISFCVALGDSHSCTSMPLSTFRPHHSYLPAFHDETICRKYQNISRVLNHLQKNTWRCSST
jgi:hypothetical protein